MTKVIVPVKNWMTDRVIVAETDHSFSQLKQVFLKYKMHHIPVVEGNKVVGIISSYDMLNAYDKVVQTGSPVSDDMLDGEYQITDIMTPNPRTIGPDDDLLSAIDMMHEGHFQAIPVVDNGSIVGILTNNDLVRYAKVVLEG